MSLSRDIEIQNNIKQNVIKMTFSRITHNRAKFSVKTLKRVPFRRMTLNNRMAFIRISFRMSFQCNIRIEISRMVLNRTTFSRLSFSTIAHKMTIINYINKSDSQHANT
jgi:hypothetical protein